LEIQLGRKWIITESELGGGGYGTVFRGNDAAAEIDVAIKRVELGPSSAREAEIAEILREEVHCKNVLPIFDHGQFGLYWYLVMPIADRCLKDYAITNSPLGQEQVIGILQDIANGIKEIRNVIHRDIKPANVLRHDGIWKIGDFGIARNTQSETSANTIRAGSELYAAPEQWREDEPVTKAIDIYSFGCLAFELLEGSPPFTGSNLREQHRTSSPPQMKKTANPSLKQLVFLMLHKRPGDRPTIDNVINTLATGFQRSDRKTDRDTVGRLAFKALKLERLHHENESKKQKRLRQAQDLKAIEEMAWLPLHLIMKDLYQQLWEIVPGIDNTASVIFFKGGGISLVLPTIIPIRGSGGLVEDMAPKVGYLTKQNQKNMPETSTQGIYATTSVRLEWGTGCHQTNLIYSDSEGKLQWFEVDESTLIPIQENQSQPFIDKWLRIIADHLPGG